jgi:CspA family cold shock protein
MAAVEHTPLRVGELARYLPQDKSLSALLSQVRKAIVERQQRRSRMSRGTVKWFNSQKGYGFIQPQGSGKDVFVHISAVEKAGLSSLNEGQVVEYEEVANKGRTSAENLKVQR